MADLQFSLSRWQPSLPSDELPSALITTHSFIFIGCKSGRIYMLKRSDLSIRVVMTGCFEIVGLALGTQQIDQPFCTLETLVSIDKSGSLCAWDVQDGRCFMHNATNISPRFLLQIGSSILISSTTDSTLHLFRSSSLELVQSVDMPRPVKQATAYDGKLHCLLVDGTVWRVDYDHLVGRIMSSATQMAEYHDICHIDGINDALLLASSHQIYLLRNDKTSICPNDQTLHGVKLMSRNKALFWTFDGKMLELDNSLCSLKLVIEGYVQAVFSEDNMLHCIMRGEKLAELTLIDGQLTFSNRQIPSQQHRVISNWVSPKFQFTDYATSDGSIFYNQSLESFLDCSDQSGAEAGMFFKGKRQATCLLRLSDDMIASGTDTGRVQFWSLNQKQIVTEFRNHTTKIMNITQVKQEIMATSFDGSASVYLKDANGISTKCIFPSRGSMVKSLRWATAHDEFLMIVYEDGHHSVWNMRSRIYEVEQSSGGSGFDQVSKLFTNQIELDNRTILPSVSLDLRKLTENERFGCVELMTKVLSPETMKKSAVGVHGAGGHVTFISPEEEFWKMSPYLSAIIHLSLLSVLHVTTATQWDQLRESLEGEKFYKHHKHILPSVSVLAKFWIDPIQEISHSAKSIMDMVISEMSLSMLEGFVGYWEQHLPGLSTDSTKSMNRSAIILGILALKDPKLLSDETKAAIAHSLVSQIGGDKRNLFRTAAIQMLGNGFQVWRPYFQPLPIFKALFSWLASVLDGGCHDPRMASSIQITEEALCQFIQHEKYSILPFWLGELSATKSVSERICGLGVISHILQTSPCSFREYTILILDHVTRMLEPGLPSMRTAMAPVVTPLLLEFTRAFPSVRLHRESQQLLVGGMTDGMVVIFELRTASRSHAFEGLTRGVSAVAFSPDAKQICAYSFDEATLRIWTVPSGLRTILGTVYKPVKTLVVDPTVTEVFLQLQKEFGEAGTAWLSLDWASPTAVKFSFSNGTNVIMYI